jgi:mRNA-degrading endonuclease RelE of RelBE toxin-antitoxin system
MSFKLIASDNFKKEAKRLIKKYRSLKTELEVLGQELSEEPTLGTPLGNDVYKIRLAISSKSKGKSGGARVISYVQIDHETVLLLSIYSKGEKDSISDKEIQKLLEEWI